MKQPRMNAMLRRIGLASFLAASFTAPAQPNEQFIPSLVYRTGPYAPNGAPYANGYADYLHLINERDGGINGVKILMEECETGYATDRGVDCYERLKGKGPTGAAGFIPLSTGITIALTEKVAIDKIPLFTPGFGRAESVDGSVFKWNFPLLGTYWSAADILIQHISKLEGGAASMKGKKITLLYHDSPYGREPIPVLQEHARRLGFEFNSIPVAHPGVEQKAAWALIRQNRPDYIFLWAWGVMTSTAIKEAVAIGYPRMQMYGVWWAGAEPDMLPAKRAAEEYNALALQHSSEVGKVHQDVLKYLHAKGKGAGRQEEVGQVLYNRGLMSAMLLVEAIRTAQAKFGDKPMTGEQVQWGAEHLNIDSARIKALGFEGFMQPLRTSCKDHAGVRRARIHTWDGRQWVYTSGWYEADSKFLWPMIEAASAKYAKEKNVTPRDCGKEK
jgi:branched-chain amino acid transport system substrate-binding protein